ncbi:MAG: ABC transporter ATP-binding protein [Bacilli bacterium]
MPRFGHGPKGIAPEKSKNFKETMIKLFHDMKKWHKLLFIALILAVVSAILGLITPNLLSKFTDEVENGIKPNNVKMEELEARIRRNITDNRILMNNYQIIMNSKEFPEEDKIILTDAIKNNNKEHIMEISDETLLELFDEFAMDGNTITSMDQVTAVKLYTSFDKKDSKQAMGILLSVPKSIYEIIKPVINMKTVTSLAIIILTLHIVSAIFNYIQGFILCTVSNNYAKNLRTRITTKINNLPLKYFDNHEMGDILSRVTNDIDSIAMNMNQSLGTLVGSSTIFLGSIVMMFVTNWIMAITAILSTLIGFSMMSLILNKSQKYFNERQIELGNLNAHIEEIYSGHNIVKAYNGTKKASEDFDTLNKKLYVCNRKSQFLSGLMNPIMGFVGNFGYVAICVVGALLTMNNIISIGVIVAFMIYVRMFTNPLSQIAQAMTGLQGATAASERVFEFLDEKEMPDESKFVKVLDKNKVIGNIEFKNVKFGYDDDKVIIKNFSAKALPGEKIAIVGPTGAGKTTIVNLLMKFYNINDGDILIDGVSIKELTRENIHDLFVMVLQDTWLFNGTVRDNIKFNKENNTDEEIWTALKTVGVDHFIKTLPGGLDAKLDDSESVSAGQKQLLTIARGMIENAPFLILDEATSNVDTRTEELVQKAMDKLTEGKTSFIIAHRLSTIKNADLILVMNEGNIIEQGKHDELMKKNGFYADLYNSQFQN